MTFNIENILRSAVVMAVGLPLTLSISNLSGVTTQLVEQSLSDPTSKAANTIKESLAEPCLRFMFSKNDSKLEREAKNDIEEIVGGPVAHLETCNWVF